MEENKTLEQTVIKTIATKLDKKVEEINLESRLVEDLEADSLDVVELLMQLEDEYGISVSDEEAVNLNKIGDIINLLKSHNIK
ncbi:MAG: acyl carrier protein [Clostridia bacterium]|nr:acyl carrier protein [Clostridia bacterium]